MWQVVGGTSLLKGTLALSLSQVVVAEETGHRIGVAHSIPPLSILEAGAPARQVGEHIQLGITRLILEDHGVVVLVVHERHLVLHQQPPFRPVLEGIRVFLIRLRALQLAVALLNVLQQVHIQHHPLLQLTLVLTTRLVEA